MPLLSLAPNGVWAIAAFSAMASVNKYGAKSLSSVVEDAQQLLNLRGFSAQRWACREHAVRGKSLLKRHRNIAG